ncbi:MAG: prepilin-type N-terminal cleavage/methylation domain [Capsulimonas sp.]|jgi:prepilin-type processing-associated H-X9-DG protein|nr:prepilin-type N-terminal cleavage/methylation domain [Capsulimonas sp.]
MASDHPKITVSSLLKACAICALSAVIFYIVFPLPQRARPKARQISCLSNMRQIGLGLQQYAQDNNNDLPPRQGRIADGSVVSWRALIDPYTRSKGIYRCPSNPFAAWNDQAPKGNDIEHDGFNRSYAVNSTSDHLHSFGPFSGKFPNGFPLSKAANPETLLAIVESTAAYSDFNVLNPQIFRWPASEDSKTGSLFCGHTGMTNVLFCDGHVRAKQPKDLLGSDALALNPWTTNGEPFSPASQAKATSVIEYGAKYSRNN